MGGLVNCVKHSRLSGLLSTPLHSFDSKIKEGSTAAYATLGFETLVTQVSLTEERLNLPCPFSINHPPVITDNYELYHRQGTPIVQPLQSLRPVARQPQLSLVSDTKSRSLIADTLPPPVTT